jgi:VWFA-related protein
VKRDQGKCGLMTLKCLREIAYGMAVTLLGLLSSFGAVAQQANTPQDKPAAPSPAADKASAPQGQAPIRVTTNTVVVPVTVKDRAGNLVADLRKDEFRIFEDKVEQQIVSFSVEVYPLSMVVLIDNDLGKKDAEQVEPSLVSIIGGLSNSDEAFICRFDQFFHEGRGFTKDQDKLMTELRRTQLDTSASRGTGPSGDPFNAGPTINGAPAPGAPQINDPSLHAIKGQPTKALDDAVYNGAMLMKDRDPLKRRKVILLISDGQNGAKFNTHKYDEVRAELFRQGIAVYSVATGSSYFERKFNRLVNYSHDTGGDIFYGVKQSSFSEFYSQITEEARNQYTLTFSPKGDRKLDYHPIEVRVRREGLTVLAREGYYGGTPSSE